MAETSRGERSLCPHPTAPGGDTHNPRPPQGPARASRAARGWHCAAAQPGRGGLPCSPRPPSARSPPRAPRAFPLPPLLLLGRWALSWPVSHFLPLSPPHSEILLPHLSLPASPRVRLQRSQWRPGLPRRKTEGASPLSKVAPEGAGLGKGHAGLAGPIPTAGALRINKDRKNGCRLWRSFPPPAPRSQVLRVDDFRRSALVLSLF